MRSRVLSWLFCATAVLIAGSAHAGTYTTLTETLNLVAGLSNLTDASAINTTNQATGVGYITDDYWSTGITNLGANGSNGILAGDFGGASYDSSAYGVILIGGGGPTPAWGSWTVRLLLSDNTYSSPFTFTDSDLTLNQTVTTGTDPATGTWFRDGDGSTEVPNGFTYYQQLNLAAFDPSQLGVKGIELSSLTDPYPDISYLGVTAAVPEPSTLALACIGLLAAAGMYRRFRGGRGQA
jgi:hypothetical protein